MITIVVTSGKGGVGKTTVTANLGAALSLQDKKILLLDGDAGLRNLDISLGVSSNIVFDAEDLINDKVILEDAVIKKIEYPNMDFVAAPRDKVNNAYISKIKDMAKGTYDYLLIDSPAGIDDGFAECANVSDFALLIVTPDVSSVRDALTTKKLLENEYDKKTFVIVNKSRPRLARKGQCMDKKDVEDILECQIIGEIKENNDLIKSSNLGMILNSGKQNALFKKIAVSLKESISINKGMK